MKVISRSGNKEDVRFDLITAKIKNLSEEGEWGRSLNTDPVFVAQNICNLIYDGITTTELDEFAASFSSTLFKNDPDYIILAGRISINNYHKNTESSFSKVMYKLYNHGILSESFIETVSKYSSDIDNMIIHSRDYSISYFGFKTLQNAYLLKLDNISVERPQHLFMRVAVCMHPNNLNMIKKVYDSISNKYYTHATPTLFNAGTKYPQLSSCFLLGTEDSVEGIYKTASDMAQISKWAGGIGVHISNIRAKDSYINKTGGKSNGIMPLLKVYNNISRHINQSGKRNGSFAVYIEPWHADIYEFLDAKKNNGAEDMRARDLFYALWVPDIFMKRVENNEMWSLMCPNECSNIVDKWGEDFEKCYIEYESNKCYRKQVNAKQLWEKIINTQIETGSPYILYKDTINRKSNQQHYGVIKSSNLCTEIVEYSDSKETAVCNLASICLPSFIKNYVFDFELLGEKVQEIVINLNNIIDVNHYPTPESKFSNFLHRPIGIGVQGLADVFMILNMPYESDSARILNKNIFECIYYNALVMSNELAKKDGSYKTFEGSPASKGILQFDMWEITPTFYSKSVWEDLKSKIVKSGLRNSLLVAPMPTASTAQIMGNNESFEPYTSNLYTRAVLSGNYIIINRHLINELRKNGLYNKEIVENIMLNKGSVQNLDLPDFIKEVYKTSWEMSQKRILEMAADRGAFICQSQSLNLWMEDPTYNSLTSMHFYSWEQGLKTGIYYLRRKPKHQPQQFTIAPKEQGSNNNEPCEMCSA